MYQSQPYLPLDDAMLAVGKVLAWCREEERRLDDSANQEPNNYTPPNLAKLLGVSRNTVLNWIRRGELKAFNTAKAGKPPRWRLRADDARDFAEKRQNAGRSEPACKRPSPWGDYEQIV